MRWSEKYRPSTVEDYVFPSGSLLQAILKGSDTPNLILYGNPGTGKTTFARLYGEHLGTPYGATDYFELSASTIKGVEEVRDRILPIVEYSSWDDGKRVCHLEECDKLTVAAAIALKPLMENYPDTVFILTTNDLTSIESALRSRCDVIHCAFKDRDVRSVYDRLEQILNAEGIDFVDTELMEFALDNHKDLRVAIRMLQLKYET